MLLPVCTFRNLTQVTLLLGLILLQPALLLARDMDLGANDSFATAQVLSFGTDGVDGLLTSGFDPLSPDAMVTIGRLDPGFVNSHLFSTGMNETPFIAYIDNAISSSSPDTTLRSIDQALNTINVDDDSSPLGNGLGSLVRGNTDDEGFVSLEVSGYSDFDFDGLSDFSGEAHPQSGRYRVYVQTGVDATADIDFYTIHDLEPASIFEIDFVTDGYLPILAHLNDSGSILTTNFDSVDGLFSTLTGTVPRSGTIHLGFTGYADFGFEGNHAQSGDYSLNMELLFQVPEPTTIGLCCLAGMLLSTRRGR